VDLRVGGFPENAPASIQDGVRAAARRGEFLMAEILNAGTPAPEFSLHVTPVKTLDEAEY
jgi:hypothetical protein